MEIPRVLLIGAGRFGKYYIKHLRNLDSKGEITFLGIVTRTQSHAQGLREVLPIPVYTVLSEELLEKADQFFIVTPPETHFTLAEKCLRYGDVFVEKPLAYEAEHMMTLQKISKEFGRVLTVGHLFRFHPLTQVLKEKVADLGIPRKIFGKFINDIAVDQKRPITHELLHWFDVIDFIWGGTVRSKTVQEKGRVSRVVIEYNNEISAELELGWKAGEHERFLFVEFENEKITVDYLKNTIVTGNGVCVTSRTTSDPLFDQIQAVLFAPQRLADVSTALKMQKIADISDRKRIRKKVAVVGAGMFGVTIALELKNFDVTIFEKNDDILKAGARVNQFRHHYGYHYPRSDETVEDIQRSKVLFEDAYGEAIIKDIPAYYGIAKEHSHIDVNEFISFCDDHNLQFERVSSNVFDSDSVSAAVRVTEPSYHYETLYALVNKKLSESEFLSVETSADVVDAKFIDDKKKQLTIANSQNKLINEEFDFVINTTYASINSLVTQLDFQPIPIRVDVAEVLILDIPIEPVSLTVIDGPFATLMPTGNKHEFTLYHVTESILDRYVPADGLIRPDQNLKSNQENIFEESTKYFPQLKHAKIKESRIVLRGVQANREHDDNRVAELISHGSGCWSILSGKILSSAHIAKELKMRLEKED